MRVKTLHLYHVTWEIDLEATSARQAAKEALKIHRDPESIATVFSVAGPENTEKPWLTPVETIDLGEDENA